jgi:DNA-binding NarL/FixJ family response regulator
MIKVILVDDQTLVRSGIKGLLSLTDDISVVAEASCGEDVLPLVVHCNPDVILLDIRMPGMSGIDVLKLLKENGCLPPAILLTTFDDDDALLKGIHCGAKGFLLKDISLERLAEGIRSVAAGATLFQPAITERVMQSLATQGKDAGTPDHEHLEPLTTREKEILRLLAGGFNNKEIGKALGTSEGTVKNHVSSILSKLGVRDRVRAVLRALDLGVI